MSNVLFTGDDCNYIKSFWKDSQSSDGEGYGTTSINNQQIKVKREVRGHYLDISDSDLLLFIESKLKKVGITSISSGNLKLTKYQSGDYFKPHRDYQYDERGIIRKTVVIQLSESSEYVGGDLIVEEVRQSREKGSCIMFNSNELHEITLITSGNRFSLVVFLFEKDLQIINSII